MINIDLEKCTGCGTCVKDCFSRNLCIKDKKAHLVDAECNRCGHCVAICPADAVEITEYDMADVVAVPDQGIAPNELSVFIKARRSIRQFKDKSIEAKLIEQIIEAGRYTPTASNRQEHTFIVVEKEMQPFRALVMKNLANEGRAMLASDETPLRMKGYAQRWIDAEKAFIKDPSLTDMLFFDAPVVILIAGDHPVDTGLAASNMELVACAQELGVLYSGFITRGAVGEEVKALVGIPAEKEVLMSMLFGYPDVWYQRTAPRKPADIVWA